MVASVAWTASPPPEAAVVLPLVLSVAEPKVLPVMVTGPVALATSTAPPSPLFALLLKKRQLTMIGAASFSSWSAPPSALALFWKTRFWMVVPLELPPVSDRVVLPVLSKPWLASAPWRVMWMVVGRLKLPEQRWLSERVMTSPSAAPLRAVARPEQGTGAVACAVSGAMPAAAAASRSADMAEAHTRACN